MEEIDTYTGTTHQDLLMLKWWESLVESGELTGLLGSDVAPGHFLAHFAAPCLVLVLAADDEGIWFAAWFTPWLSGASVSLWVREDKRKTRQMAETLDAVMRKAFKVWTTIIVTTVQPLVAKMYKHMGAKELGVLPGMIGGKDAWLLSCCQDTFTGATKKAQEVTV